MSLFPPSVEQSPAMTPHLEIPLPSAMPLIQWRNIFVVVDDGKVTAEDYEAGARLVLAQAQRYPGGIGGLTVIPPNGRPPSDASRQAIKQAYESVTPFLRSVCWLVEGQGFRAATVRAALAGLRLLLRPPFPTKVAAHLDDALPWLTGQLGTRSAGGVADGVTYIRGELDKLHIIRQSLRPIV